LFIQEGYFHKSQPPQTNVSAEPRKLGYNRNSSLPFNAQKNLNPGHNRKEQVPSVCQQWRDNW